LTAAPWYPKALAEPNFAPSLLASQSSGNGLLRQRLGQSSDKSGNGWVDLSAGHVAGAWASRTLSLNEEIAMAML
jgi:hypothetical protein